MSLAFLCGTFLEVWIIFGRELEFEVYILKFYNISIRVIWRFFVLLRTYYELVFANSFRYLDQKGFIQ